MPPAAASMPTGPCTPRWSNGPAREWPVLIKDHHDGYITWADYLANEAQAGRQPHQRRRPAAAGGHARCARGSSSAAGAAADARQLPPHGQRPPTSASRHDRLTTPTAGRSPRHRGRRSADGCSTRSTLSKSRWRWPRPTRSTTGTTASAAPPNSRLNAPATKPTARSAPSAVEPENRLVARSLEARWEAKLAALAEAEKALHRPGRAAAAARPGRPGETRHRHARPVARAHHSPSDRKRLLRTLIADVTLLPEPDRAKARIGIRWHTGAADEIVVARRPPGTASRTPTPAIELARELGPLQPRPCRPLNAAPATPPVPAGLRHEGRPVDPPRLPHPGPGSLCRRRGLRRRGRPAARLQRRRHLLLDRNRPARRPPRPGQPAVHPLDRQHRGRLPRPHRQIRPPQPAAQPTRNGHQ